MFKIQTLNNIAAVGLKQFQPDLYEVSSTISDPDAILVRSHDMHTMKIPSTVKVIGRAGSGVNNIPVHEMTKAGIPVLNTVGANANAVRELVIAGMLLACRNICSAWEYVQQLKSESMEKQIEENKKKFAGFELMGKTLGVIGLGSIGVKVANSAMNLGMSVIGYDPTITVNRAWELSSGVSQAKHLDDLLKHSDFITLHVPLNSETKNLIDAAKLAVMKNTVVLLNFARDGIIDNAALKDALEKKKLSWYVTDFPTASLKDHPHVISLPHLGASTKEAEDNCAVMIVKQVKEFLERGNIISAVNFPTIEMPKNLDSCRIAIVNENVPNIVAQISSKLADHGFNIISLLNGSKETIAYTLIDVNKKVSDNLLSEISKIKGIIHSRRV